MFDFIFNPSTPFAERLSRVFEYQIAHNPVYRTFSGMFGVTNPETVTPENVPLLPIRAFKEGTLYTEAGDPDLTFRSSGTASQVRSIHRVARKKIYETAIEKEFYRHFPREHTSILCYTPGYSENPDSSLVWMLHHLVKSDPARLSRFLPLHSVPEAEPFREIADAGRKPILFGAAFGLLDMIEGGSGPLPAQTEIIETGGMKTYRREVSKSQLRRLLGDGFQLPAENIHSEYGMCELLSQCYALGGEWFTSPHWVEVSVRNPDDPLKRCSYGEEGKIGIIDLANIHSCPFILTDDRGVMNEDGEFQILGRWHDTELRGCNFLIDED
jgi:hypothetical protein